MSVFDQIRGTSPEPRRKVRLPPSGFAETWARRPHEPTDVGLRLVSEHVLEAAQKAAFETAWGLHPDEAHVEARTETFNDHAMSNVLAQATTKADDVNTPFFAPIPEDLIRVALTPGALRRLWNAYLAFAEENAPGCLMANDAEVRELLGMLPAGLTLLDDTNAARVRRLLGAALEIMKDAVTPGG